MLERSSNIERNFFICSYLLFTGGTSFRPWHFDLEASETAGDMLATLLSGRKIWMFCKMGRLSASLRKVCGSLESKTAIADTVNFLRALSRTQRQKILWCEFGAGETVYMPYGCGHSVATFCEEMPSCMVTVDVRADLDRATAINNSAHNLTDVGHRR